MTNTFSFIDLPDGELLAEVTRLSVRERSATAQLVAALAELDARRLYLGQGCSSLFTYCTQVLHLSEHAAYNRIQAARAARRFPVILERLADASVHLTAVRMLDPHFTAENHRELLDAARHKSKPAIEQLVARLHPKPAVPPSVRKLPTAMAAVALVGIAADEKPSAKVGSSTPIAPAPPAPEQVSPARRSVVSPLAPERYKVQFTVSTETFEKLRRVQNLMRHRVPDGDPAAIFDCALTALLSNLERTKLASAKQPRNAKTTATASRHVPAVVKRAVWARDGGRCAFVGTAGRCGETGFLEFHHLTPYASGGQTTAENLELRCRAHNMYEAERYYGRGRPLFARERGDGMSTRRELVPERVAASSSGKSHLPARPEHDSAAL
jgi:5-methylcytosine-specific restriction endonuclease McrA